MMKKDDENRISKKLGLTLVTDDNSSKLSVLPPINKELATEPVVRADVISDHDKTRKNIKNIVDRGEAVIDEIIDIAMASQDPKAFMAAAAMMKTLIAGNKELLSLQKTRKEILSDTEKFVPGTSQAAQTITNNQYNLTTSDMLKALKNDSGTTDTDKQLPTE